MQAKELTAFLNRKVAEYNQPDFILNDPIVIPHRFHLKQDIEIMGLFAAVFAWGQRKTIIQKCDELIHRMDGEPYSFIQHLTKKKYQQLIGFKHRTFNDTDLLYFVHFLNQWYAQNHSLEDAFAAGIRTGDQTIEFGLNHFRTVFFRNDAVPSRTYKHIASPAQHSACKRLNMYLRWMVRKDDCGVDFGIWKKIKPAQLICPLDLHVQRVALELGLMTRTQSDWKAAIELTNALKQMHPKDPVRYDFALFGLGVDRHY